MEHVLSKIGNFEVGVDKGSKSKHDFKVKYREMGKRERTPKHIHLVIDILLKRQCNPDLTQKLIHFLNDMLTKIKITPTYPPSFQIYKKGIGKKFSALDNCGEYPVEFLIAVFELIMIQEKTNYPNGTMNVHLFQKLEEGADIFSLVSAATFTR